MTKRSFKLSTLAVHAGESKHGTFEPLATPIVQSSTFVFPSSAEVKKFSEGKSRAYMYTRYGNPTLTVAQEKMAALEQGEAALVFSSGMAAIATAVLALLRSGDQIIAAQNLYGGTFHLFTKILPRFGITTRFFSDNDFDGAAAQVTPRTRMLYVETPANPIMQIVDLEKSARLARTFHLFSMVDSTFATPILQRPLELGFHVVMHSVTKYLGGHSDIIGGVLVGAKEILSEVHEAQKRLGGVMDPATAYLLIRGLKTLDVRVRRQCESALKIARWAERHPKIKKVFYPGLKSSAYYRLAKKQMHGLFGGMIALDLRGGLRAAARFADRLRIITNAASLGGVESLISIPVYTSHWGYTRRELEQAGITEGTVRISIGLEDAEDLIQDMKQALG